jgi:hypothetical protein
MSLCILAEPALRRLNNGQTGESGGVLPQTDGNIFLRTTIKDVEDD